MSSATERGGGADRHLGFGALDPGFHRHAVRTVAAGICQRRASRERDRLLKERSGHTNRITGLLHAQGIRDAKPFQRAFIASLESMRTGDERALPPEAQGGDRARARALMPGAAAPHRARGQEPSGNASASAWVGRGKDESSGRSQGHRLLEQYTRLRIDFIQAKNDPTALDDLNRRTNAMQTQIWGHVSAIARERRTLSWRR